MNDKPFTSIKLYLSPSEKAKIESISQARGISMSEYCKNLILQSGINITVKTDDLSGFAQQVSQINNSVKLILSITMNSTSISPDQIENIDELLTGLNRNCRMLLKDRYKKRKDTTSALRTYIRNYLDSKFKYFFTIHLYITLCSFILKKHIRKRCCWTC